MVDLEELGMNASMQPNDSIPATSPHIIDEIEFRNTHRIPSGFIDYYSLSKDARFATAVVSLSGEKGTYKDIQAAVTYVNGLGGGVVLIKAGTYFISSQITLFSNVSLIGEGDSTVIDFTNHTGLTGISIEGTEVTTAGTITLTKDDATVTGSSTTFSDDSVAAGDILYIAGLRATVSSVTTNTALELTENYEGTTIAAESYTIAQPLFNITISDLLIKNYAPAGSAKAIYINYGEYVTISRVSFVNCDDAVTIQNCFSVIIDQSNATEGVNGYGIGSSTSKVIQAYLLDCNATNNSTSGATIINGSNVVISGGSYSYNGQQGIRFAGTDKSRLSNAFIRGNPLEGIYFSSTSDDNIISNNFVSDCGSAVGVFNSQFNRNVFTGNNFGTLPVTMNGSDHVIVGNVIKGTYVDNNAVSRNIVKGNVGLHDNDYDVGLGTVGAGTAVTSVTFSYLGATPETVIATPTNSLGSASEYYVDTIGTTTFNLNVNTAPGTAIVFNWRVDNEKP